MFSSRLIKSRSTTSRPSLHRLLSSKVRIVEVGPRDGLQNEKSQVATSTKLKFIELLASAGLNTIEATSFVSPKWVPQMSDHTEIMSHLAKSRVNINYPVLVPNTKGLDAAMSAGAKEVAVFTAASDTFSLKNTNCDVKESLNRVKKVVDEALKHKDVRVRGYVSCVMGCPYEGPIESNKVADVTQALIDMGCYEVSLGDTIGIGTVGNTSRLLETILSRDIRSEMLAAHFHDTYGQALANVAVAVRDFGLRVVDASVAGLGGCPYAEGAAGNVATEDVVYMLHNSGFDTGVDLNKLVDAGNFICHSIGRENGSKVAKVLANRQRKISKSG